MNLLISFIDFFDLNVGYRFGCNLRQMFLKLPTDAVAPTTRTLNN